MDRRVRASALARAGSRRRRAYLHNQLVGAGHQGEAVGVVEGLRDVLAECVACPSGRDAPTAAVVRVRPQQVAHGALQRGEREGMREREREREEKERIGGEREKER